ncbi:MAG: hypothetical protein ACYS0D_11320 [Planctomycetota bacterium]|jgi:hypothetical protein
MKTASLLGVGVLAVAGLMCNTAHASFHFMQIEQAIGGVDGDTTKQAIQLRMRSVGQNLVAAARMRVFDDQGLNPVTVIDFGSNVLSSGCGVNILVTSANFALEPSITPDFTMTNLIPASYLAAGSITFESDTGIVYWRLSWGGAGYTGPVHGSCTNDDSPCPVPADFGVWPNALPSTTQQALEFQPACSALSTSNQNDYAVTAGPSVWRNNVGQSGTVPVPCPEDINGDNVVNVLDLIELLLCFGLPAVPGCEDEDVTGDGTVNVLDLIELLLAFGTSCP